MKPFLKYRGGKSREIPSFINHIPENYNRYVEPFFGGGSLFFHLQPENSVINDLNEKLFKTYLEVRNNYEPVRKQLDELEAVYNLNQKIYEEKKKKAAKDVRVENKNEELYYELRNEFNYPTGKYLDSVLYFFINKTSYSGMIRYNKKGEFNVPFGRYKNFNTNLLTKEHSNLLQKASLLNEDYFSVFKKLKNDDFVFLDPPYDCVFNDYGNEEFRGGFGEEEHRKLAMDFKNLNCKSIMVISKTDLIEDLYKPYIVEEYTKNYSVNIRNRFKNEAKHCVIKNF